MVLPKHPKDVWKLLQAELQIWQVGAWLGLGAIALVSLARVAGLLQPLELTAFDALLRWRPPEPVDPRILIVGIDEGDIQRVRQYPIPDREIAALIRAVQQHQPAVIGLDLIRDLPVEPGHAELVTLFRRQTNLYGTQRILPDQAGYAVLAPPDLPAERVGFAEGVYDPDGYLRRSLLGLYDLQDRFHFSFPVLLAEAYLGQQGYYLKSGLRDPHAMRFGSVEFPRFQPYLGGYGRQQSDGVETLLNFRSGRNPFQRLSMRQILAGDFDPAWVRDRVVIIGITAISVKDVVNSAAIPSSNPGLINGVEVNAHEVSQILSAVLDQRPLLQTWPKGWEYFWIVVWGLLGMTIGRFGRTPWKSLLLLAIASVSLGGIAYGLILIGWWIPLIPSLLVLTVNAIGPAAAQFYRYEQDLRTRLRDRQLLIEQTFTTIHNGALQTLARMLSQTETNPVEPAQLNQDLRQLNQELRAVYDTMHQEALSQTHQLRLSAETEVDLQAALHEILFQVYDSTLQREFPGFQTLKVKIVKFEPMDDRHLSLEQKRGLCRFLEEALCNVGKHAQQPTRLTVICAPEGENQVIRVMDNGTTPLAAPPAAPHPLKGFGSQQAHNLANSLRGQFRRYPNPKQGMTCELTWQPRRWRLW